MATAARSSNVSPPTVDDNSRVVIVQRSVPPYRVRFFDLLRQRLAERHVTLDLCYSYGNARNAAYQSPSSLPWATRVPSRHFTVAGRTFFWQDVLSNTHSAQLVVMEQATSHLHLYHLFARSLLGDQRLALWGHGLNFSSNTHSAVGELLRRWVTARIHWFFAYTSEAGEIARSAGLADDRISVVENSSDSVQLRAQIEAVSDEQVAHFRKDVGLEGGNVGAFIGSLHADKRLDFVISAARDIRRRVPDFSLLIIGDGPGDALVDRAAEEYAWIHALRARRGAALAVALRAADVFIVPAWVGLVVVDSFAAGKPLIASASQRHPPEINYIEHGVNGIVVDDGGLPEEYAESVADLLRHRLMLAHLQEGCRRSAEKYTAENMADRFANGIVDALNRRRG